MKITNENVHKISVGDTIEYRHHYTVLKIHPDFRMDLQFKCWKHYGDLVYDNSENNVFTGYKVIGQTLKSRTVKNTKLARKMYPKHRVEGGYLKVEL